jgi:hypothetical protein
MSKFGEFQRLCRLLRLIAMSGELGPTSWSFTLSEILAIKEWLAEYITDVVDAYLGEKNT